MMRRRNENHEQIDYDDEDEPPGLISDN